MNLFREKWLGLVECLIFVRDEGRCRCCWLIGQDNIMFIDIDFKLLYFICDYNMEMCV